VVAAVGLLVWSMLGCASGTQTAIGVDERLASNTVPVPSRLPPTLTSASAEAELQETVAEDGAPPQTMVIAVEPPPRPLRQATFVFTGDTLVHSPLVRQAERNAGGSGFDFAPMFDRVRPLLAAADLAVCHLETPIAPPGEALSTAPTYGVPGEIAIGLAGAGYDRCSTASNHSMDRGVAGIDATVSALASAGISETGMARAPEEAITTIVDVGGIAVAHISYTYGLNGLRRPAAEPWRVNLIDDGQILDAAAEARARGADVVVLSLHWGTEGVATPNPYQVDVANTITASGLVDLIVGHHAHVPQPVAQVNATWVAFGLGNFLSNMPTDDHWPRSTQDGVILGVTIAEQPDGTFLVERPTITPTWVDRLHGWVIRPVVADLADPSVAAATRAQLQRSLERALALYGDMVVAG
jgi:poly-gamma-glutamate synthesis protein (capsule biosynthesis protein)